jgi:hypothetical protein
MKNLWTIIFAALPCLLISLTFAQAPQRSDANVDWNKAPDPLVIAPRHYSVVFENDRVRVLRFVSHPGDKWAAHRHSDGVHISLSEYDLRNVVPGNAPTEIHRKPGDARWVPAVVHTGENIGSTDMRSVIIELKK